MSLACLCTSSFEPTAPSLREFQKINYLKNGRVRASLLANKKPKISKKKNGVAESKYELCDRLKLAGAVEPILVKVEGDKFQLVR